MKVISEEIRTIKDFPTYHVTTRGKVYRTLKDGSLREVKGHTEKV